MATVDVYLARPSPMTRMKPTWLALLLPALLSAPAFGSSVDLEAFVDFRVDGVRLPAGDYQVFWGQITPGNLATSDVFSVFLGNEYVALNDGIFSTNGLDTSGYVLASLLQTDNLAIPAGVYMGLAITTLPYGSGPGFAAAYPSNTVILWDWNWITPAFTADDSAITFSLSRQTRVAYLSNQGPFSRYSYNGGVALIDLVTVPEPSSFAVMTGLCALGFAALRRRRSRLR